MVKIFAENMRYGGSAGGSSNPCVNDTAHNYKDLVIQIADTSSDVGTYQERLVYEEIRETSALALLIQMKNYV